MAAEVRLVSGYQSCHRSGERIALLTQSAAEALTKAARRRHAEEVEECHRVQEFNQIIIDAYDLLPLPFIYMVRGYRILNPRLIPYYSVINFINPIGSVETHAGVVP
jgi:hypothetical protein